MIYYILMYTERQIKTTCRDLILCLQKYFRRVIWMGRGLDYDFMYFFAHRESGCINLFYLNN